MSTFRLTIYKTRMGDVIDLVEQAFGLGLNFDVVWEPDDDENRRSSEPDVGDAVIRPTTDVRTTGANPHVAEIADVLEQASTYSPFEQMGIEVRCPLCFAEPGQWCTKGTESKPYPGLLHTLRRRNVEAAAPSGGSDDAA